MQLSYSLFYQNLLRFPQYSLYNVIVWLNLVQYLMLNAHGMSMYTHWPLFMNRTYGRKRHTAIFRQGSASINLDVSVRAAQTSRQV